MRVRLYGYGSSGREKGSVDLMWFISVSHRPQSYSCPLWVSIETKTGSTVGAESNTEDREDPHTKGGEER